VVDTLRACRAAARKLKLPEIVEQMSDMLRCPCKSPFARVAISIPTRRHSGWVRSSRLSGAVRKGASGYYIQLTLHSTSAPPLLLFPTMLTTLLIERGRAGYGYRTFIVVTRPLPDCATQPWASHPPATARWYWLRPTTI